MRIVSPRLSLAVLTVTLAGCGDEVPGGAADAGAGADSAVPPADAGPDPSEALYDPAHIVEVDVTLAAADWDVLREQTRTLPQVLSGDCLAQPFPSPFTYFSGEVTVDGTTLTSVGVRKKGFIGSLSTDKPSLKLKFNEFVSGQKLLGQKSLVLNNVRQDPSYLRTCLAYATFTAAGVPAPRCNFAHVVVNGDDLGLYVHVEGIDDDFVTRHFADDTGNLYEGTLSDFRPEWIGTFEMETNEATNDGADLLAVQDALTVQNAQLEARVAAVVDLDAYYTFWAAETLLNHWDGYAQNTNNFYVYHDPASGLFRFLPWGADAVLQLDGRVPTSVTAEGYLARRLYLNAATRDVYLDRLRELLDTAWDEDALDAEITRMQNLIASVPDPGGNAQRNAAIAEVRQFVQGRRAAILAEIDPGPPAYNGVLKDAPCFVAIGQLDVTFATTWDTLAAQNVFATGTGTLAATVNGTPAAVTQVGSKSGLDTGGQQPQAQVQVIAQLTDGTFALALMNVQPPSFAPATFQIDWQVTFGALYHFNPTTMAFTMVGVLGNGTLTLDEASMAPGQPVAGSWSGELVDWPF